jgi:hypothetical protein
VKLIALLGLLPLLPGCATSLDHQAELLLHPAAAVQLPALAGSTITALLGIPVWGTAALAAGSRSDVAGGALHVFAYPGALLLGGIPWLVTGPSWRRVS